MNIDNKMASNHLLKDIHANWLNIREYMYATSYIFIHPAHTSNLEHFEMIFKVIPHITPRCVIYYNDSGRWTYNDINCTLILYASPFDVVINNNTNKLKSSQYSTIWMKYLIQSLIKFVKQNNPNLHIIWKCYGIDNEIMCDYNNDKCDDEDTNDDEGCDDDNYDIDHT